jgi:hypothetical protein
MIVEHQGRAPVAHACNPTYSGGKDQADYSSKPAPGKQSVRPYLKNTQHKTELEKWLKWWSAWLQARAQIQTPVPQKKEKNQQKI